MKTLVAVLLILGMASLANAAVISLVDVTPLSVYAVNCDTGGYAYMGWLNLSPGLRATSVSFTSAGNPNGDSIISPWTDYGDSTGLWAQFTVASLNPGAPLRAGNQITISGFYNINNGYAELSLWDESGTYKIGSSSMMPDPILIAGYVRDINGNPITGVTMNGLAPGIVTDEWGFYSAYINEGWSGTVSPSKAGYNFSPINKTYSSVTESFLNQNYIVPEPATMVLLGFGGIFLRSRKSF